MRLWKERGLILAAAILWGVIGWFYDRFTAIGFRAPQVVLLRVLCAAICMTVFVFLTDRSLFKIRVRDLWMFAGSGVVSLAMFNVCYFAAMDRMDVSVAATLLYTAPLFVMILSAVLFKEVITVRKILSLIITSVGCLLVTGVLTGATCSWTGFVFGIGSGIGYALYSIFGVISLRRYRSETVTLYTFWLAVIGILPLCQPREMVILIASSPVQSGLLTLGIGIVCCLLPYALYTKGLVGISPSEASIMATLEPVVAAVVGWMILDDTFSWTVFIGMICIVGAIVLLHLPGRKKGIDHH